MELTQEQMDQIILNVVKKVLVKMPGIIGNLMSSHAEVNKLRKEFFDAHPHFAQHKPTALSVIEKIEAQDLSLSYEEILKKAVPEIDSRIALLGKLSTEKKEKLSEGELTCTNIDSNGVL